MIAYKRMLAVMYEAACNDTPAVDVVRVMSNQMAHDKPLKRQLALLQAAVASIGTGPNTVRDIETESARVALIEKNKAILENLGNVGDDDHKKGG